MNQIRETMKGPLLIVRGKRETVKLTRCGRRPQREKGEKGARTRLTIRAEKNGDLSCETKQIDARVGEK